MTCVSDWIVLTLQTTHPPPPQQTKGVSWSKRDIKPDKCNFPQLWEQFDFACTRREKVGEERYSSMVSQYFLVPILP